MRIRRGRSVWPSRPADAAAELLEAPDRVPGASPAAAPAPAAHEAKMDVDALPTSTSTVVRDSANKEPNTRVGEEQILSLPAPSSSTTQGDPPAQAGTHSSPTRAIGTKAVAIDYAAGWERVKRPRLEFNEDIANASSVPQFSYTKESIRARWKGPKGNFHGFNTDAEDIDFLALRDEYERLERLTLSLAEQSRAKTEFFKLMLPRMEEAEKERKLLEEQASQAHEATTKAQEEARRAIEAKDAEIARLKESLQKLQQEKDSSEAERQALVEAMRKKDEELEETRLDMERKEEVICKLNEQQESTETALVKKCTEVDNLRKQNAHQKLQNDVLSSNFSWAIDLCGEMSKRR